MRLMLTGRRLALTPALRGQVERKMARLERVLNDSAVSAQCVLEPERQGVRCELSVHARGGHVLHGLGRHRQPAAAVGAAVDKVLEQAHRLADRWRTRRRAGRGARTAQAPTEGLAEPVGQPRVVRARPGAVKPMRLEDAMLALASGREPVLIYRDAVTEQTAILYRRADGDYGLIEPEA
jgi:putative sigma-54 modulation protein